MLAPVLPVIAYFSYLSLMNRLAVAMLWPLVVVGANWAVLFLNPDVADALILMTYLSFGIALLRHAATSSDALELVHIGRANNVMRAMILTGAALAFSALIDVFVIVDFIKTRAKI